jgi:hypothetical protein
MQQAGSVAGNPHNLLEDSHTIVSGVVIEVAVSKANVGMTRGYQQLKGGASGRYLYVLSQKFGLRPHLFLVLPKPKF